MFWTMRRVLHQGACLCAFVLLQACGGGSGGSGNAEDAANTREFDTGLGFLGIVRSIVPAIDGSGDLYVGGSFVEYNGVPVSFIARLNRDGSLDTGFDTGTGFNDQVFAIATIDDGSGDIYVAGWFTTFRGNAAIRIARLGPDGSHVMIDTGSGFDNWVTSLESMAGGDVYVGGLFDQFRGIDTESLVRMKADGTKDIGFDIGTGIDDVTGYINDFDLAPGGDLYVAGYFTTYDGEPRNSIVRVNGNGSVDLAFNPGSGFDHVVNDIAIANDGSNDILTGGFFTEYDGVARSGIARINDDGSNEVNFISGAGFSGAEVGTVVPAIDGSDDIYVGGTFTAYDGVAAFRIARLNADGSLDPGFVTGSGFDDGIETIAAASDGSGAIYVGGSFSRYNGTRIGNIVRLLPDGTLD